MGVHGLWRLIEPSGKPVPLETLENKVLAVDVSIWLHQAIKGFQDSKGAPVPNAHLLGIYHRVCKLLYFKVKPIFIFDGGVPALKKQTIAKRHQQKSRNISEAERLQKQLLNTLLRHTALSKVLSEKTKASLTVVPKKISKYENMYALPPSELDSTVSSSEDEDFDCTTSDTTDSSPTKHWDLHTIDMTSVDFRSLPVDVRHEILTELKETRKQNSWGKLHELPKQSDDFSIYQMRRLLKRQAVQSALEDAEKEMGGHSLSMAELESLLKDHGVATTNDIGKRIASDENTRYLLIKDVKQALEKARKEEQLKLDRQQDVDKIEAKVTTEEIEAEKKTRTKADLEYEEDLQKAIALSLQAEPSTSKTERIIDNSEGTNKFEYSFLENFKDEDFQSDSSEEIEEPPTKKTFSSAQNYMMEYSGLTPNEIAKILQDKNKQPSKKSNRKRIILKTAVADTVEIMSDSDESNEFVEVSLCDQNTDDIVGVSSGILEKHVNESSCLETSKENNEVEITSTIKINESTVSEDIVNIESTDNKSRKAPIEKAIIPTDEESDALKDEKKIYITVKDDTTVSEINKSENSVDVEIMSDSDSSGSIQFSEISENKPAEKIIEIVIDPNQSIKDDLFGDIFSKNESQNGESIPIIIQPQAIPSDDLFSDIFNGKVSKVEESAKFLSKQVPEQKKSLEVIKENEILAIQKVEKSTTGEVGATPFKSEKGGKIKNSAAVNLKSLKAFPLDKHVDNNKIEKEVKTVERQKLNVEQMRKLKDDLQNKKIDLMIEKSTKERMANNITDQMYQEAQDLLELFGVPYIVAPMEAEAQCAFLDEIELTDGTITDDSDIWLFGGRTVYKNFFNQSKFVMEFKAENIKHNFKLTREQLILFALLVGSDYTVGLQGVGPVTALEILAAFPPSTSKEISLSHAQLISGLKEFRSWFNRGKTAGPGRSTLKSKLNNVSFTDNFPSLQVVQAYLEPTVETSREKFSWAKPNFIGLKEFAKEKFGWSAKKAEEILKPVFKRVEETREQKSIKDFFKTVHKVDSHEAENKMSKRVKTAIDRIGKTPDELIAEEMEALSKAKQKKSRTKKNVEKDQKAKDEIQSKPTRKRAKQKADEVPSGSSNATIANNEENTGDLLTGQSAVPKPKRSRKKLVKVVENISTTDKVSTTERDSEEGQTIAPIEDDADSLEKYEHIAIELKKRRQRKNDLSKIEDIKIRKQNRPPPMKISPIENIPEVLEEDEEVQLLKATTSRSLKRVEKISQEVRSELSQDVKKKRLPDFHKKDIIHQKLRDKSDLLRNKLKAIEVFRKSKKGPGYVKKQSRCRKLPKQDAELSENSSDE